STEQGAMNTERASSPSQFLNITSGITLQSAVQQRVKNVAGGVFSQWFAGGGLEAENAQASVSMNARIGVSPPIMEDTPAQELMGLTTGVNSFQGAVAFDLAKQRFKAAHAFGDTLGMVESVVDMLRGIVQSLMGTAFLGFRVTQACVL